MLSSRLILWVFLTFFIAVKANAFSSEIVEKSHNQVYSVSDNQIEDFLRKFIANSVENVKMLVEFVTKLLRDAISGNRALDTHSNYSLICLR